MYTLVIFISVRLVLYSGMWTYGLDLNMNLIYDLLMWIERLKMEHSNRVYYVDVVLMIFVLQLQGGGDMALIKNFNSASVRQGFIIDTVSSVSLVLYWTTRTSDCRHYIRCILLAGVIHAGQYILMPEIVINWLHFRISLHLLRINCIKVANWLINQKSTHIS